MGHYAAKISWARGGAVFTDNRYSRAHAWSFDGGAVVPASASPQIVRPPLSDPSGVDPEEALVAAVASCHMLFFLAYAAQQKFTVDSYVDNAEGTMAKNAHGQEWLAQVKLRPRIAFSGETRPTQAEIDALHHRAHRDCYIANSVKAEITVEPA